MERSDLIRDLQAGKEAGLTAVFRLYNRSLLYFSQQFVPQEVGEEIVADTFLKVWELRDRFNTMDRLRAFLYIATKNACLNYLRSPHAKRSVENISEFEDSLTEDTDTLTKIVQTELIRQIYEEVAKLPHKQREVFSLTYLDDLSVEEISGKLKISPSAVYINRSRALNYLRSSLKLDDSLWIWALLLPVC
ncbi:RNA polymerase sigma factor [Parapedobacter deserti]|uniref:RNA polymerase sigma factor n=1 Tax=Parapedobacter deserti TaxID=1912957 RepID=A0ABV7JJ65_9SPHI